MTRCCIVVAAIVAAAAMPAAGQSRDEPVPWATIAANAPFASFNAAHSIDVSSLTAQWHVTAAEQIAHHDLWERSKSFGLIVRRDAGELRDISLNGRFAVVTGNAPPRGGLRLMPRGGTRCISILFKEEPDQPKVVVSFRVPVFIYWAAFVHDDFLLTYTGRTLILWRWRDATAMYHIEPLGRGTNPRMDHDRRHVTWCTEKRTVVLDAMSGTVRGVIDFAVPGATVRVSPDGTRVALNRNGHLTVLHGADAKIAAHIVYRSGGGDECWWLDNRFILTGGGYLLDTFIGIVAWRFDRPYSQDVLLLQSQKALTDAQGAIDAMVEDEVFAVRPGVAVSLDVSVQGGPDAARRISAAITQRLADQGVMVAENQPVTLVATWKRGRWRVGFGDSMVGQALAFVMAPQRIKLAFVQNGVTLWCREQLVDELASPDFSLLEQSSLPRLVAKAEYLDGLGQTQPTLDDK